MLSKLSIERLSNSSVSLAHLILFQMSAILFNCIVVSIGASLAFFRALSYIGVCHMLLCCYVIAVKKSSTILSPISKQLPTTIGDLLRSLHILPSSLTQLHIWKICKVGNNSLSNRLYHINDQIPLTWLNASFSTFKVNCKKMYLNY